MNNQPGGAEIVIILFVLAFYVLLIAFMVFVAGTIFRKAGYSFWFGLLMLVPIGNFIWLLIFAFSKWPIQHELEMYRAGVAVPHGFPVGQIPPPPMPPMNRPPGT